jgi:TolB protein
VYIADYDGENVRRVTAQRRVNISPSWSPDGRLLAYTAWAPAPDIFVQHIYEVARPTRPAAGNDDVQSAHAAWSPDGTRLAFSSKRGGAKNYNIYVVNRDGTNLRQLTTGESGDVAPTWSPSGGQIAYVSGRTGKAQLYLIGADGTNNQRLSCQEAECDHPSWSAVVNKIAYSCGSSGAGYDICLLDMGSRTIAKLTDGSGSNEQPSFAPNGRHVLFVTTRWGKKQLATVDVTGTNLKRLTTTGNNNYPDWSHAAQ